MKQGNSWNFCQFFHSTDFPSLSVLGTILNQAKSEGKSATGKQITIKSYIPYIHAIQCINKLPRGQGNLMIKLIHSRIQPILIGGQTHSPFQGYTICTNTKVINLKVKAQIKTNMQVKNDDIKQYISTCIYYYI